MIDKVNEFLAKPIAQKWLFFNEMLTPGIIRIAYWLCLLAVLWAGLGRIFSGSFGSFFEGIIFIVIGGILARMGAELVILLFKLNENIEKVVKNTRKPVRARKKVTKKATE